MASTCSLDYVQRENVAAAIRVFSEHGRAIKSMIAYHVKDPSAAEDIYQDLFVSLVNRPIPDHVKTPLSYLWRAVVNDIKDAGRKRASYEGMREKYRLRSGNDVGTDDPYPMLEVQERIERLVLLIQKHLRPHEARAVLDRYILCKSLADSAKDSNVRTRTLSRYLCTGRKTLRAKLQHDAALSEFFM